MAGQEYIPVINRPETIITSTVVTLVSLAELKEDL